VSAYPRLSVPRANSHLRLETAHEGTVEVALNNPPKLLRDILHIGVDVREVGLDGDPRSTSPRPCDPTGAPAILWIAKGAPKRMPRSTERK
jgi:hypothetical protein